MVVEQQRVFVAGSRSLIGAALLRCARQLEGWDVVGVGEEEPDWTDPAALDDFFASTRPEWVFVAAGSSGGIEANRTRPADLSRDNLLAATHLLHAAHHHGAKKLLYLASSCVYPKHCAQPMREEELMHGPLEPTSQAYATAKLAGLALCRAYRDQHGADFTGAIAADAFGPGDCFVPGSAHVIPALIQRMHEAREAGAEGVEVWGSGKPRRDFLFVEDLADACFAVMRGDVGSGPINLGGGTDCSIREVAEAIRNVVGFEGTLRFDTSKPDGMDRKILDATQIRALGWQPRTSLPEALEATYAWYLAHVVGKPAHA